MSTTAPPATIADVEPLGDLPPPPEILEIVYRVERLTTGVIDTEQRLVRTPFEVRIETHRAEPDDVDLDADPVLLDLEVLGGVESGSLAGDRALLVSAPAPARHSAHLGTDLDAAQQAGVLEPLGHGRRIAGRTCAELRTGAALDGGILRPPTDTDRNDVCVDDDGLVLREEITVGGHLVERRTAVSVDVDSDRGDLDDAFTPLGHRIPEADGGGRVRRVTLDSRPPDVPHFELDASPAGTERIGRFGVLTDSVPGPNAAAPIAASISMVDVHVGGGDVVVVENGAAVTGTVVLGRGDVAVPLSFAADATAVFLTSGVEIRASLEGGRFLRLVSTLSLRETVALAESMRMLDGPGAVEPADGEPDVTGRLERPS